MTVMWFGRTSKRRKEPAHAPGAAASIQQHQPQLHQPSQNSNGSVVSPPGQNHHHHHSSSSPQPVPVAVAVAPPPPRPPSSQGFQQPPTQLDLPYRPGPYPHSPPPQYPQPPRLAAPPHPPPPPDAAATQHGGLYHHPSQTTTTLTLAEAQQQQQQQQQQQHSYPPLVTVSPPSTITSPAPPMPEAPPPPPPMYHANSNPAWLPPPSSSSSSSSSPPPPGPYQQPSGYYYHAQPDPNAAAAASQTSLVAYQASPPQMSGQWGPPQQPPPSPHQMYLGPPAPAPQPSPPMQQLEELQLQELQYGQSHQSQQGFNARLYGALTKPGRIATQSLGSLNTSYQQKKSRASQSVTNLNDGLARRQKMASRSVSNLHDRTNQYMAHTVALCDQISSRLDQIISSIDDEVFSGNEQDLVIYEHPPEPHQSSLDVSKGGNNQHLAAVAGSSSNHFSKVWQYANSRLPPHLPPLKVYMPTWPLLCLAAQYSEKVYRKPMPNDDPEENSTHVEPDWRQGTKAMVIKSVPVDDMNTIVFAIRGSAGFMDWAVNFRPAPASPKGFLDDEGNLVHSGFLYVARKMVAPVAARLKQLLSCSKHGAGGRNHHQRSASACSLLITGHSAGGAVAALLYAHMMAETVSSELNALTRLFKRVHCVTFGAPPVSLLPLRKPDTSAAPDSPQGRKHKKSLFFAFINEGDPVVRADKEVIKNMLRLYATPAPRTSLMPAALTRNNNCSVASLALASSTNLLTTTNSDGSGGSGGSGSESNANNALALTTTTTTKKKKQTKSNSWSSSLPLCSSANKPAAHPAPPAAPPPAWSVPPGVLSCAGRLILLRDGSRRGSGAGGAGAAGSSGNPLAEHTVEACTVADEQLREAVFGDPMCHMMRLYARRIEVLATRAVTAGGMDLG